MFGKACVANRKAIYAMFQLSHRRGNVVASAGTAFAIGKGILATSAHSLREECKGRRTVGQPKVIRSPDVGLLRVEPASIVALDDKRDIAILEIENPRCKSFLKLLDTRVPVGTTCGSISFPFSVVEFHDDGPAFGAFERFQAMHHHFQ